MQVPVVANLSSSLSQPECNNVLQQPHQVAELQWNNVIYNHAHLSSVAECLEPGGLRYAARPRQYTHARSVVGARVKPIFGEVRAHCLLLSVLMRNVESMLPLLVKTVHRWPHDGAIWRHWSTACQLF